VSSVDLELLSNVRAKRAPTAGRRARAGENVHRTTGQGFGSALLRDAMMRAVAVARDAGVFAIMVHAISPEARQFYLSRGFVQSPLQPMTLIMTLETVRSILTEPH